MATLRKRLGNGIVSALKGGDTLLNSLLGGAGSTLNVEYAERPGIGADPSEMPGHCIVAPVPSARLEFEEGEMRGTKRRAYAFRLSFIMADDGGADNLSGEDLMQALERIFADPRAFMLTRVSDPEGNLAAHAAKVELDEDFRESPSRHGVSVDCRLTITVTMKSALVDNPPTP